MVPEPLQKTINAEGDLEKSFQGGKPIAPPPPPPTWFPGAGSVQGSQPQPNERPMPAASSLPSGETVTPQTQPPVSTDSKK
jgi:hypothetical protein